MNPAGITKREVFIPLFFLFDGDPHGFVVGFGFYYFLLEAVQPDVAVEHFSYFAILAHQDATLSILGGVLASLR